MFIRFQKSKKPSEVTDQTLTGKRNYYTGRRDHRERTPAIIVNGGGRQINGNGWDERDVRDEWCEKC